VVSITLQKEKLSKNDMVELLLLGSEILQTAQYYEIEVLKWIENIDSSPKVVSLLESAKEEISKIFEIHSARWGKKIEESNKDEDLKKLETKLLKTYAPNFDGPLLVDKLFPLSDLLIFKEFCKLLKSKYQGPMSELVNLICKGFTILRIAAFLSLEYNTLILPNTAVELINHLEKENIIKSS
jgi:hypothetical protein